MVVSDQLHFISSELRIASSVSAGELGKMSFLHQCGCDLDMSASAQNAEQSQTYTPVVRLFIFQLGLQSVLQGVLRPADT